MTQGGTVRLDVFDVAGRRVRTLLDRPFPPGPHRIGWNGKNGEGRELPAGVYFVRLTEGSRTETTKIVLRR